MRMWQSGWRLSLDILIGFDDNDDFDGIQLTPMMMMTIWSEEPGGVEGDSSPISEVSKNYKYLLDSH